MARDDIRQVGAYDIRQVDAYVARVLRLSAPEVWRVFATLAGLDDPDWIIGFSEAGLIVADWSELTPWERANVLYRLQPDVARIAGESARSWAIIARREGESARALTKQAAVIAVAAISEREGARDG